MGWAYRSAGAGADGLVSADGRAAAAAQPDSFRVSVPHDEAEPRIRAVLAAGGTLVYDAQAPAFWVLADAEGNEACVTTWQGRDG